MTDGRDTFEVEQIDDGRSLYDSDYCGRKGLGRRKEKRPVFLGGGKKGTRETKRERWSTHTALSMLCGFLEGGEMR